jgi:hypothetical protein
MDEYESLIRSGSANITWYSYPNAVVRRYTRNCDRIFGKCLNGWPNRRKVGSKRAIS